MDHGPPLMSLAGGLALPLLPGWRSAEAFA